VKQVGSEEFGNCCFSVVKIYDGELVRTGGGLREGADLCWFVEMSNFFLDLTDYTAY